MFYMTFVEESDSNHKYELSLFANDKGKLVFEMKGDEDDPYQYSSISLTNDDARALIKEIQRIIDEFEIA